MSDWTKLKYGATEEQSQEIERVIAKVDFSGLEEPVKKLCDDVKDKIWTDVQAFIESDLLYNIQSHVSARVRQAIEALLRGDRTHHNAWVFEAFEGQRRSILRAVYEHNQDRFESQMVADLLTENKRLKDDNDWLRGRH